jgi:hypothetical protein
MNTICFTTRDYGFIDSSTTPNPYTRDWRSCLDMENQWERKVAGRRGYKEIYFLAGWRFGPLILKVGASPSQLILLPHNELNLDCPGTAHP